MDFQEPYLLTNILTSNELESTPPEVLEKLKKFLDGFFGEYCKEKAAANRLHDYEQKSRELEEQINDYEIKLQNYERNVNELRDQLDKISKERSILLETKNVYDKEVSTLRIDKDKITDERDSVLKVIERQNIELERLQREVKSYQQQLRNAINAKCEAIAKIDEIQSKEVALDFKERRMDQERAMLHSQIQTLTNDLNRQITESQSIRRENTTQNMHLKTRLIEKTEELNISQSQCNQYKEQIEDLSKNIQKLSSKLHTQNEEATKMIDFYKKELEAKSKLAELYKNNCSDSIMERNELLTVISDLKRMLTDASEQYGDLETKNKTISVQYEQEIDKKDKLIKSLKDEIAYANDILKEVQNESVESAVSKLAPSAAIANRLIKSNMSLTELYSMYFKASHDLELQKRENGRLNLQMKSILQELNETAPSFKKQEMEFEKLLEENKILIQQREEIFTKLTDMEDVLNNLTSKVNNLERENKKLKHSLRDSGRQVCYLLKEIEQLRIGLITDNKDKQNINLSNTDEIISKKLVTFADIEELQENNEKLLMLVRDFTTKLEEAESLKKKVDEVSHSKKIENYAKKVQNMQDTINQQSNSISVLVSKCERYKKLYFEKGKSVQLTEEGDLTDEELKEFENEKKNEDGSLKLIKDLETQLNVTKDQYKVLKEQYEYYIQEKKNNEKIINEQFNSMRQELRELTSSNCKLTSSLEYFKEQIKLHQKNTKTYQQQILALEGRNKNYETTIIKHEQTIHMLKDELFKIQKEYSTTETQANNLQQENNLLKDTASRLQSEKEDFLRNQRNQNLLLNNLEMIKSNLERSEIEGRARLEQRLDETLRELAAQRLHFQEEESRFSVTIKDFKLMADVANQRLEEERCITEKKSNEIQKLHENLVSKSSQIDDLSLKLQESLTPLKNDNPFILANKRVRELEIKLEEAELEVTNLSNDLTKSQQHADQYFKMSQSAEMEIKNLHDAYTKEKKDSESKINELTLSETHLKNKINELESELQICSISQNQFKNENDSDQRLKIDDELKTALAKLNESNKTMRTLRSENTDLTVALNAAETKYATEMVQHSADIQELSNLRMEMSKIQDQIHEITIDRDTTQESVSEIKKSCDKTIDMLKNEKMELENRIIDLHSLNSSLHDQIEALTSNLSIMSQNKSESLLSLPKESMLDSSITDHNQSSIDYENKNSEQLLQIIKFVRKEKDLTVAKLDILKAENARLSSEHTIMQKKIDELNTFLNQERVKTDITLISAAKHEEILRKIETLNAITDSNRILREERNLLSVRAKELNERVTTLEDEIFPLQNQNREFSLKIDDLTSENASLRTEAMKWRQRANVLVEKSNKNPEEFKRLQMERENLAKMLTNEKENLKQTNDELNNLKTEKMRLEMELCNCNKQLLSLNEEKKKLIDEISGMKQNFSRVMQEVMDLKNNLLQKEEVIQKLSEDIESKESQLQDSKNKEIQIRKIAKRYKDSYLELSNKNSTAPIDIGNSASQETIDLGSNISIEATSNTQESTQHKNTNENLNNVIRNLKEENEKLKKDLEDLKACIDVEEHTKSLLSEAKTRVSMLQESNVTLSEELIITKRKLESSESQETIINDIKNQYEETLARMEKEIMDQNNLNKELNARLVRENEALQMRINQLTRQLGIQQCAKPSTSSTPMIEKPCISELSPRTANVKPMSGSASVQHSVTVTPWRGNETPLASIRPISVQNSRTAAILPTSQQNISGSSSNSVPPSSIGCSNTALVPPQQQVHTTGNTSVELMSTSPTSSHNDYMPSTSSNSIAIATIPPMGATILAESSQEAESVQQPQLNESAQLLISGQQQVVALVSPRVEGSIQTISSPNIQAQLDTNNQQPSTSGSSSTLTINAINTHNRHTPSSSNVTTSQAGTSGLMKRPRETEGDSASNSEECSSDKSIKHLKRMRNPVITEDSTMILGVSDSGMEIEYEVPTSSQRDQEDDVVVVDSEEDDVTDVDDGQTQCTTELEVYEDSYEQERDVDDENGCIEVPESNMRTDVGSETNEVDVNEAAIDRKTENDACTSQESVKILSHNYQQDNNQQSQTISSGSCDSKDNISRKHCRQPKVIYNVFQEDNQAGPSESHHLNSLTEVVSISQEPGFVNENKCDADDNKDLIDNIVIEVQTYKENESLTEKKNKTLTNVNAQECEETEDLPDEATGSIETYENTDAESFSRATQSDFQGNQENQTDFVSEDIEGTDGVSSEGEKRSVEELEEEGREAEASTSPSINTRSKAVKGGTGIRRTQRSGYQRGGISRPTPIIWQESTSHGRSVTSGQRNQDQSGNNLRGFQNQRSARARRMRRPNNYTNMRFS